MKTMVDIPKSTLQRAKTIAAAEGITLEKLLARAIRETIRHRSGAGNGTGKAWMQLAGAFGKTPAACAETRRIQNLIDKEFEGIDPEDR